MSRQAPHTKSSLLTKGFTLVEILIVVVILGILAAVIVPQFASAVTDASVGTAQSELSKLERAIDVYFARNENSVPDVTAGNGTWGPLLGNGEYLKDAPTNPYVGGENARVIALGTGPDTEFQTTHGWIFNESTGEVWAGGFDEDGEPLPRD